ncbi:hypothetical protein ES705_44097 [subsurface metagenome]
MDNKKKGIFIAAIMVISVFAFAVTSVSAHPANWGFETGDLTGWTVYVPPGGSAQVVTSHAGSSTIYNPVEGNYFAELKTNGPGTYTTLTQDFYIAAGVTIQGWAAFDARDYLPFNDNAAVRIRDSSNNVVATPWYSDVSIDGDYGDGPWTYWEWTAPVSDTYTLELRISNAQDSIEDSYALFDGIIAPAPVPTLTPIGIIAMVGLLSIVAAMSIRKRR